MTDITFNDVWSVDIPAQFQDKRNIGSLISAFSRQLDELMKVNEDLVDIVNLKSASGQNLDMIGDIVNMPRRKAYELMGITGAALDDITYRSVLLFQILKNNSDATYDDIMRGLRILWGNKVGISYIENPFTYYDTDDGIVQGNEPATIKIQIDDLDTDDVDPMDITPMVIKPGGVKLYFGVTYHDEVEYVQWEKFEQSMVGSEIEHYWDGEYQFDGRIKWSPEGRTYHYWDGTYKWDGTINWGPEIEGALTDDMNAVLLSQAMQKMLKFRATGSDGWKIAGFAFGTGVDLNGERYMPTKGMTTLVNEVLRIDITSGTRVDNNCYTYTAIIPATCKELDGKYITEYGLYDTDGDLVCVKTIPKKLKQAGKEMTLSIDDTVD